MANIPPVKDETALDASVLAGRTHRHWRQVMPPDCRRIDAVPEAQPRQRPALAIKMSGITYSLAGRPAPCRSHSRHCYKRTARRLSGRRRAPRRPLPRRGPARLDQSRSFAWPAPGTEGLGTAAPGQYFAPPRLHLLAWGMVMKREQIDVDLGSSRVVDHDAHIRLRRLRAA